MVAAASSAESYVALTRSASDEPVEIRAYAGRAAGYLEGLELSSSAATVAGSALIAESADPLRRTVIQGRADLTMSGAGAVGGALAGPALAALRYEGLALLATSLVAAVLIALAYRTARRSRQVA